MKITKRQLKKIIREEKEQLLDEVDVDGASDDHTWPRVDWDGASNLADKWHDMEIKSFDTGDPSMNPEDSTVKDNKDFWREQVDSASYDLENELTVAIRKLALAKMKEITERLINGEYA